MTTDYVVTDKLSSILQACSQGQLREGRLDVKDPKDRQWSLYFHLGHLVGDAGGVHPVRRWRRQLAQYCPQLGVDTVIIQEGNGPRGWDYEYLAKLVKQNRILRHQMVAVVEGSIAEVLFDILQQQVLLRHRPLEAQLTYTYLAEGTLYSSPLVFIRADQVAKQARQAWSTWQQAGLEDCSPNLAPVIWQHEKLQHQTSPSVYRSLTALVDGKRTIRDLALKLRQEPLLLLQSLIPYIRRGLMGLIEVADLSQTVEQFTTNPPKSAPVAPQPNPTQQQSTARLVAYIDDSPMDSQIMGQIVTKAGLRYISIQDSVQALPMLLEHKPSLIFLDLVMPIANGYEICAQIRRTSIFKDTPVIIVTGNDGIVDRVRAKIVRSSDFLAKPIDTKKVVAILRKYLSVPSPMGKG